MGFEPHLRPTPQLIETPEQGHGSNPYSHGLDSFTLFHDENSDLSKFVTAASSEILSLKYPNELIKFQTHWNDLR